MQRAAGNGAVHQLLSDRRKVPTDTRPVQRKDATAAVLAPVQQKKKQAGPAGQQYPWLGEIHNTWSGALRKTPHKDPHSPYVNITVDLPPGTNVRVLGQERGWLHVEVTVDAKLLKGYVSHELVKFVRVEQLEIDPDKLAKVLKNSPQINVANALTILKRAEIAMASSPHFAPDAKQADQIQQSIWVLEGKYVVDHQTYRVSFHQDKGEKARVQTIEDFILFVEAVERQYPKASAKEIASEVRQLWFAGEAWEAMLDSRGVTIGGQAENLAAGSNPIAKNFDLVDLAPATWRNKAPRLIETAAGKVVISHVMTGVDGALSKSGNDGWRAKALRDANKGDPRDFVTWSGDLGQAYAQYVLARWLGKNDRVNLKQFVDDEASTEQLLGDIQGYVAHQVWLDVPDGHDLKVSNILRSLYLADKEGDLKGHTYRDYVEKISGKKGDELREFIVDRTLRFAALYYAKETSGVGTVVYHGGVEEAQKAKSEEFQEFHQTNESQAVEADRLGGLITLFMKMLEVAIP